MTPPGAYERCFYSREQDPHNESEKFMKIFELLYDGLINQTLYYKPVSQSMFCRAHHKNRHQVFLGIDPETSPGITALVELADRSQKGGSSGIDTRIETETSAVADARGVIV